jgi:hypothetical protein
LSLFKKIINKKGKVMSEIINVYLVGGNFATTKAYLENRYANIKVNNKSNLLGFYEDVMLGKIIFGDNDLVIFDALYKMGSLSNFDIFNDFLKEKLINRNDIVFVLSQEDLNDFEFDDKTKLQIENKLKRFTSYDYSEGSKETIIEEAIKTFFEKKDMALIDYNSKAIEIRDVLKEKNSSILKSLNVILTELEKISNQDLSYIPNSEGERSLKNFLDFVVNQSKEEKSRLGEYIARLSSYNTDILKNEDENIPNN